MRQMTSYRRDSLFDFMSDVEKVFDQALRPQSQLAPSIDWQDTEDSFLLSLDLPGVEQKDIRIEFLEGRLSVSGERKGLKFERTFQLPQNVNHELIQARSENGVLEILIPKVVAKPRQITVETSSTGGGLFSKLLPKREEKKEQH